jgi:hypothetical protein
MGGASLNLCFCPSGFDPQNRHPHQHVSCLSDDCAAVGSPTGACQLPEPLLTTVVPRCRRVSHLRHMGTSAEGSVPCAEGKPVSSANLAATKQATVEPGGDGISFLTISVLMS